MQKSKERLDHALHNEAVCEYLMLKQEFADWIITTAFYSSLQFVTYKIFPYEYKDSKGHKHTFENVDELIEYKQSVFGNSVSKHRILADLVAEKCPEIANEYDHLLGMSKNARYNNYQHPKEAANQARSIMLKIKKYCSK